MAAHRSSRSVLRAAGVILIVGAVAMTVTDSAIGWFAMIAVAGGLLFAALLVLIGRRHVRTPLNVPDSIARDSSTRDMIDISHIHVAGVGGLGLVAMALVVATQFRAIGLALVLGLAGGLIGGAAFILRQRRRGPLDSGRGVGARTMLVDARAESGVKPIDRQNEPPSHVDRRRLAAASRHA
jgi:hypothetical protein